MLGVEGMTTKFAPSVKDELVTKIALRVAASPRLAPNWQSKPL
jgi:hypothetical protein